jgi:uncharacterized protein (DUF1697 family)
VTTYIVLLRAVNVGGRGGIAMAALRDFAADLGFREARTLLQSGNLVFQGPAQSAATLERALEAEAAERLGLRTAFFVRTTREWDAIIAKNPFPDAARSDPSHLVVLPLKDAPSRTALAALRAAITGPETVELDGRHAYIVYPAGIGTSRLTNAVIERKLGTPGTGRNWNTVVKLAALARG